MLSDVDTISSRKCQTIYVFEVGCHRRQRGRHFKSPLFVLIVHTKREHRLKRRHEIGIHLRVVGMIARIKLGPRLQHRSVIPPLRRLKSQLVGQSDLVSVRFILMLRVRLRRLEAQPHFQLVREGHLVLVVIVSLGIERRQQRIVIFSSLVPVFCHIILHELQGEIPLEGPEVRAFHLDIQRCIVGPGAHIGGSGRCFRSYGRSRGDVPFYCRLFRFARSSDRQNTRNKVGAVPINVKQSARNRSGNFRLLSGKTPQRRMKLRIIKRIPGKKREIIRIFENVVAIVSRCLRRPRQTVESVGISICDECDGIGRRVGRTAMSTARSLCAQHPRSGDSQQSQEENSVHGESSACERRERKGQFRQDTHSSKSVNANATIGKARTAAALI